MKIRSKLGSDKETSVPAPSPELNPALPRPAPRSPQRTVAIVFALVAVVFGLFLRTLESGFLRWDDDINVFENPHVQGLTGENLRWMFTDFEQAIRYKPLSWLTWAVVHEVFGLNSFGYHLANVLLHCANAVLVFLVIRRLLEMSSKPVGRDSVEPHSERSEASGASIPKHTVNQKARFARADSVGKQGSTESYPTGEWIDACAALGALLWAVHPLRVEPVAWVTGLPYGLSLLFLLVATLFYLRAHSPQPEPASKQRDYWLSVAAFALAVLSYPIVLGYIAVLLALDFFPLRRLNSTPFFSLAPIGGEGRGEGAGRAETKSSITPLPSGGPTSLRAVLLDKLPFLALSLLLVAGTLYGRFHVTGTWDKPVTLDNFPPFARAMQAFYIWAYYAWKPLLPLDLCPVYPVLMESKFNESPFLFSMLGVLAVSAVLFAKRRAWPGAFALWLAHLGLLVPMLGLTERPHYPHDRYDIINGILWSVAFAAVLWQFVQVRAKSALALGAGAGLVMLLAAMSWRQTSIWHSDLPFFTDMAAKLRSPHYRSQALMKLGNAHADLEDDAKAIAAYHEALQLSPSSATYQLHFNLGNALARQTQWKDAAASYANALRLKPDSAAAHLNSGIALAALGDLNGANHHLARALELSPQSAEAHAQLAEVLTKQGKPDQAREHAAAAERLHSTARAP